MSSPTEIAVIPSETALQVFTTGNGLDPYLHMVRAEIDAFVPDVTTAKGRSEIASMAFRVSKIKVYLDGVGKDLADAQKEIPKKIDAERKRTRDTLDNWRDEVRAPLTRWEEAEKARTDKLSAIVKSLQEYAGDKSLRSSEFISAQLVSVNAIDVVADVFGEYFDVATRAKESAVESLTGALSEAIKREKDEAELAMLRKEKAEKEAIERKEAAEKAAKEREELIAKQAADRARLDAEKKAAAEKDEADRRERDLKERAVKAEAEAKESKERAAKAEREAKEKAEREQAERIAKEREELARREANKKHRASVNSAALKAFVEAGLDNASAKIAVEAIARKSIPCVRIEY